MEKYLTVRVGVDEFVVFLFWIGNSVYQRQKRGSSEACSVLELGGRNGSHSMISWVLSRVDVVPRMRFG